MGGDAPKPDWGHRVREQATIENLTDGAVRVFASRPHQCCSACLCIMLLLSVVSIMAGLMSPEDREGSWEVHDGTATQWFRAYKEATKRSQGSLEESHRRLEEDNHQLFLFYKADFDARETIFTPQRLVDICRVERLAVGHGTSLHSPLSLFYGVDTTFNGSLDHRNLSNYDWSCEELPALSVHATVAEILRDVETNGPHSAYAGFVHPKFVKSGASAYTRSIIHLRGPNKTKIADSILSELGLGYGFLKSAYQGDDDRFVAFGSLRVRIVYPESDEMNSMIGNDFIMAFGAIVFVYAVMWIHLKSCFLATCGMIQICLSLPIAALFYRGVFQVDCFQLLHILVVYLVLGIGADDIFVLVDTFRQVLENESPELEEALRRALKRSASAIFNTSFTTTVAFLSCSVSKVTPMRTLGWYAALCIVVNYVLTITYTPAALVIYHLRFQGKRCCCPAPSIQSKATQTGDNQPTTSRRETWLERTYIEAMGKKMGPIRPFSLVIVLMMLATAIRGVYFTAQLTPPSKAEVWVPDNHMTTDLTNFWASNYYSPDYERNSIITVFWGIKALDMTSFDVYRPDEFSGTAVFDESFDLSTPAAQQSVLDMCEKLQTLQCSLPGCRNAGYGTLMLQTLETSHTCFLQDFKDWLGGELPTGNNFSEQLKQFRDSGAETAYSSKVLRANYAEDIGFVDGELRYAAIRVRSTLPNDEPFGTGVEVRELVATFVDHERSKAPSSLQSIKFHANGLFANYDLGEELLKGFFSGCAIALPIAFLVLLVSTRNFIVALYAVLSVAAIVLCVLGFCKSAMDWDLGIGEAIAGVIVIGYSVDYVVHLAHTYCEAKHHGYNTRGERAEFAARSMGSTVLFGALTTAGSGAVMFFCFFTFFFKMAVLICVTILFSFLFSLGFFMGLVWLIGPENNMGDLPSLPCEKRSDEPEVTRSISNPSVNDVADV